MIWPAKTVRRCAIIVAVLAIVGGAVYSVAIFNGAVPPTESTKVAEVRIGTFFSAIDYAPFYVAKQKGWFEEELEPYADSVKYTEFQSFPAINESFASSNVDFVFEAEPPAIIAKAGGIEIQIIAIGCTLQQDVLVHADSNIQGIVDLKGKKVGVLAGTSSHYGILKLARTVGLEPSDLTILDMSPPDAKAAFDSRQIDAWAVWPPFVEQEVEAGIGRVLPGGNAQIHSIVSARSSLVESHREIAVAVATAIERSKVWMEANPDEAIKLVAQQTNVAQSVATMAWPKHDWLARFTPDVIDDIQKKAKFLVDDGRIRTLVNVRKDLIAPVDPR